MRAPAPFVLLLLVAVACGPESPPAADGGGPARGIVVVSSDYVSTAVALVDPATGGVHEVLHSGSHAPGLTTALSGDVVLPSTRHPDGLVTLVDRYPNAVLTFVDPVRAEVVGQLSVSTGFASNPHDVAFLPDRRAYVTRYEPNPAPTAAPDDFDEGDDLLVVALEGGGGRVVGRVPLADGAVARPERVALAGGLVWVTVGGLDADFAAGGASGVVGVDPSRDAVRHRVVLPELANCIGIVPESDGGALWVACSGVFRDGVLGQRARSGLARIDVAADPPAVTLVVPATALGERPLGADVAVGPDGRVLAVVLGDLDAGLPDRLVAHDPVAGTTATLAEAGGAFALGGLVVYGDELWFGEAATDGPGLHAWSFGGAATRLVDSAPKTGLPPRALGLYGEVAP